MGININFILCYFSVLGTEIPSKREKWEAVKLNFENEKHNAAHINSLILLIVITNKQNRKQQAECERYTNVNVRCVRQALPQSVVERMLKNRNRPKC